MLSPQQPIYGEVRCLEVDLAENAEWTRSRDKGTLAWYLRAGIGVAGTIACLVGVRWVTTSKQNVAITSSFDDSDIFGEFAYNYGTYAPRGNMTAHISLEVSGGVGSGAAWDQSLGRKCWEVVPWGQLAPMPEPRNGFGIHLVDCGHDPDVFIIPVGRVGKIKLARHPDLCLDAPVGGSVLQFWNCSEAPLENILWVLPPNRSGQLTLARTEHDPRCINIPFSGQEPSVQQPLQQWNCAKAPTAHVNFVMRRPANCAWTQWSEWLDCDVGCGGGQKKRTRREQAVERRPEVDFNCQAYEEETTQCNTDACDAQTTSQIPPRAAAAHAVQDNSNLFLPEKDGSSRGAGQLLFWLGLVSWYFVRLGS